MTDIPKTVADDEELGLVTEQILDRWLNFDSITLFDAALLANDASPDAGGLGLNPERTRAVSETFETLQRSGRLKPVRALGDDELYVIGDVFNYLHNRGYPLRPMIKKALINKGMLKGIKRRPHPHGNAERYETVRNHVLMAMVRALADPVLHPSCRKDGETSGPVVGSDLARTIIANQQALFEDGKAPQRQETIAKLFNDIVPPKVR